MSLSDLAREDAVVYCKGERFRLYLSREQIKDRVRQLGETISRDLAGQTPVLIGVLNGSFMFLADLLRAVDIDCEVDFLKLSSYGAQKISSGVVRELKKIDADIEGRHVIVVEDIVDTGLSMQFILEKLQEHGPASVKVATLLHKYEATRVETQLDYVGFRIPDLFVIGYGLDYGQLGRNLDQIYIMDDRQEN
jgi:hypoxanthine phosphoribosyltransferase